MVSKRRDNKALLPGFEGDESYQLQASKNVIDVGEILSEL